MGLARSVVLLTGILSACTSAALIPTLNPTFSLTSTRGKTPVDAETYKSLLKYGDFTLAAQLQPCAEPPQGATIIQNFNIQSTDTQAALFKLDSSKELILAFPGTASEQDIVTDLTFAPLPFLSVSNCQGCLVHGGFGAAFASLLPSLEPTLLSALQQNPDYKLTIAGYSLGGGLSKLAFVWARDNPKIASRVANSYSYGEPRVGNAAFAKLTDQLSGATDNNIGLYRRVTHANDGVPRLPPLATGFVHSLTEIWEQDNTATHSPSLETTYRCYGREPLDCVNSQLGIGPNDAHGGYAGFDLPTVCSKCKVANKFCK